MDDATWAAIKERHKTPPNKRSHPNPHDGYVCSECASDKASEVSCTSE